MNCALTKLVILNSMHAKYECACGFVGKAAIQNSTQDLAHRAWINFYAHRRSARVRQAPTAYNRT